MGSGGWDRAPRMLASARPAVRTGDVIDGNPVSNVVFCEEGLNDRGQLAFVATLDDADAPDGVRIVWVRATPTAG